MTLVEKLREMRCFLTLKEAGAVLHLTTKTLRRWSERGRIPAKKLGAEWRLDPAVLANWLEQQEPTEKNNERKQ
jgi:excisionase family DNA binding protein